MESHSNTSTTAQLKEKASELVEDVKELGSLARNAARETLRDTCAEGRNAARTAEQKVEDYVTRQPVTSLVVAAGIGFLLGCWWRRR